MIYIALPWQWVRWPTDFITFFIKLDVLLEVCKVSIKRQCQINWLYFPLNPCAVLVVFLQYTHLRRCLWGKKISKSDPLLLMILWLPNRCNKIWKAWDGSAALTQWLVVTSLMKEKEILIIMVWWPTSGKSCPLGSPIVLCYSWYRPWCLWSCLVTGAGCGIR